MSLVPPAMRAAGDTDSVPQKVSDFLWISQLVNNGFHINNPGVQYPRFPRFALRVYNWGDRLFNSYDSAYVVGTGKNWKALAKSYNWFESTTMFFSGNHNRLSMVSNLYCDVGAYLCFMAVNVGYMFNANDLIGKSSKRHSFNLDFTCSRFTGSYREQSAHGGMNITRFGGYNDGHGIDYDFDGVDFSSTTADILYFFNNKKYSHAAAYCFSKYQLRSAGSWIVGASFAKQSYHMDFRSLPVDMLEYLPLSSQVYTFRHNDYAAIGGYGYNFALAPRRWTLNLTGLLALGYKHSYENATDGRRNTVANNLKANFSVVYNHRALFASVQGRFDMFAYYNSNFWAFNTFGYITAMVGARF